MTLIGILVFLVVLVAVCFVAFWLTSFLPAPMQVPARAIIAIIALIILLAQFWPNVAGMRVGGG